MGGLSFSAALPEQNKDQMSGLKGGECFADSALFGVYLLTAKIEQILDCRGSGLWQNQIQVLSV